MSTCVSLTKRMKYHQKLLEQFTNRWRREYLLSLREHHSVKHRNSSIPHIKVGDVVLLHDESTKRSFWKLAVMNELIQGSDNKVRAAVIKVGSDKSPAKLLKRSIQHLIPIEVDREDDEETATGDISTDDCGEDQSILITEDTTEFIRPRRRAAVDGEVLHRVWTGTSRCLFNK